MKKPNKITRAIIDATVDRGLREIAEDPKRSIRKLVDMGKQFSKTRFLEEIYTMMQDLLRNDESPYYTVIENLLRNTTRQGLKDFGINIGYNSLTFGGKLIREEQEKKNYYTPWTLALRLSPDKANTLSIAEVENCIEQGRPLGIYTYILRFDGSGDHLTELFSLFTHCKDCSFFVMLPDQVLTAPQLHQLTACTNIISLLSAGAASCEANIEALREKKCLYGIYTVYGDSDLKTMISPKNLEKLAAYRAGFLITVPRDDCSEKTREQAAAFCRKFRVHPTQPFIPFDAEAAVREVDHIVTGNDNYIEMLENGDLRTPDGTISDFRHTIALEQILQIALPKEPS